MDARAAESGLAPAAARCYAGPPMVLFLAYAAFVSLGLPDTVLGVAWPSAHVAFGVSPAGLGLVLTLVLCGHVTSSLVVGFLVKHLGVAGLLAVSTAFVSIGLLGYAWAPKWEAFLPMAVLVGLGSGAIDAALNGYAAQHFSVRHVNWLHACWGVGATVSPLLMTAVLSRGHSFREGYAGLAGVLGFMALVFVLTRRAWLKPTRSAGSLASAPGASAQSSSARAALRNPRVWLQIAIFFVYTGFESGVGQWAFTILRQTRAMSVQAAGGWTSAYWGSLLAGRILLGFIVDRVGPDRVLRVACCAACAGAVLMAWGPGLWAELGLLTIGLSLAPVYPTLMSRSPARLGPASTYAIGFQVSAATVGTAVVPGLLGLWLSSAGAKVVPPAFAAMSLVLLTLHEILLRASWQTELSPATAPTDPPRNT